MYDNICKFLAETYSRDFASWLLGESIELTALSPSELSLEPIRADALILLESDEVVLHLEFQTEPDETMPFRMLDYRTRVYRRFPNKIMRQVVIYLRETGSELVYQTSFHLPNTRHEFEVVRLWEIPSEELLEFPGLLPLAPLGKTGNRAEILRYVAERVEGIQRRREKSNAAAAASILAGLVLRKDLIRHLFREEIVKESVIYQDILARGEARGEARGKAAGKQEGETILILRQLTRRFGEISPDVAERIRGLPVESLEQLGEDLLDFSGEEDLVAWLSRN
ncbi:Rpn family recombination-promoting nuclease/putative transposase [Pannus brasiliensis CCIBt3594]|uniref:Rpn family recombination-promoting nuclease/putative transposase n=1 Tax=Pannus brasiliensis CCIBt3594 TaxID=1427578 RepID=A0AAW9QCS2_9CHRO